VVLYAVDFKDKVLKRQEAKIVWVTQGKTKVCPGNTEATATLSL
jgi:hypothetical protein